MNKPQKHFTRRDFLKLVKYSALSIAAAEVATAYSAFVEPAWVEVKQISLKLPRLPAAFKGFRLMQISDIHFNGWITPQRFTPFLDLIYAQQPDAIAITGDFVQGKVDEATRALDDVRQVFTTLRAKIPTFAVLGNHDHWTDAAMVRRFLHDTGIPELRNDVYTFKKDGQHLYLCGVDDTWMRQDDLKAVTRQLTLQDCAILMAHEPDYADTSAATGYFDLQLSGHSHGGQVVIPFFGPPLLPPHGQKYHTGLYQVGNMLQYTNRGLGMVNPTIRFNCRPEITVFTL